MTSSTLSKLRAQNHPLHLAGPLQATAVHGMAISVAVVAFPGDISIPTASRSNGEGCIMGNRQGG